MTPLCSLPSPPRSRARAGWPLLAVIAILASLGSSPGFSQGPPSPVRVEPVRREVVENQFLVTGDLRAVLHSSVATQEEGLVVELPVREGTTVARGDLLARLDPIRLTQERASIAALRAATEADRQQRIAELEMKTRDVETLVDLTARNVTNPKELADARSDVKIAEAQLARAVANLADLDARLALHERRLADLEIRAPFAGTVVARHIDLGEWITPGDATVELVSTGSVEAWLNVPAEHRAALVAAARPGSAAFRVRVDAVERTFTATAARLVSSIDRVSRNFPFILEIPDADGLLAPGMSVTASIPTGQGGEHLLVSKDAILRGTTGSYIFLAKALTPDGPPQALPMPVRILFPSGDRVAVEAPGLQPGDLAIVEGNERLMPMMPVLPSATKPAKAPDTVRTSGGSAKSRTEAAGTNAAGTNAAGTNGEGQGQ